MIVFILHFKGNMNSNMANFKEGVFAYEKRILL